MTALPPQPPPGLTQRLVFVRGLMFDAYIGVYDREQGVTQPVRIDLELDVVEPDEPSDDQMENVVCYNRMTRAIRDIIAEGHINLVETLAERIAGHALDHPLVRAVMVRVDKPNAIPEAASAGVEIRRAKPAS